MRFMQGFIVVFSTHDLSWRSTIRAIPAEDGIFFQLTTSRGGRLSSSVILTCIGIFQLTTSRGGRLCAVADSRWHRGFSTHDLSWRSTKIDLQYMKIMDFSTHDLSWRSTNSKTRALGRCLFQLTTSRGGRRQTSASHSCPKCFSTHDLSWRSTLDVGFCVLTVSFSTHDLSWRSTER